MLGIAAVAGVGLVIAVVQWLLANWWLRRLARAYRDNRAVLQYEPARRRLEVGSVLAGKAPQPVVVRTDGAGGDTSASSTLLTAQLLPRLTALPPANGAPRAARKRDDEK